MSYDRIYNFCAGPCTLPVPVLEELRDEMLNTYGGGYSILESSHRSAQFESIHQSAIDNLRELLVIPDTHQVLFIGGGATYQFSMLALNLLSETDRAGYCESGQWGNKAFKEAKYLANVESAWSGASLNYTAMPSVEELKLDPAWQYLHITSNETIGGVRFTELPQVDIPLVIDASSDILTRPIPWERVGVLYAGAQKNLGPAGLGVIVIRNDQIQPQRSLSPYMTYKAHAEANSLLNTPPTFQIWALKLVLDWVKAEGGLSHFAQLAQKKSALLYDVIDSHQEFYANPVRIDQRSLTNVVFTTPSEALDKKFVSEAEQAGLSQLKGHRSVGGCRASIYNAMPLEGVEALAAFMRNFAASNA